MMEVRWSIEARRALDNTVDYIAETFGMRTRNKFKRDVQKVNNLLKGNPHLGAIEPLLVHHASTYRSIVVNHLNKIIYRIEGNHIEVADFWKGKLFLNLHRRL